MTAIKMTNAAFQTWVNTYITTNGSQDITGAILNEAFSNILLSVLFADIRRDRRVPLTGSTSNTVLFPTPFPAGTEYTLICIQRDFLGDNVGTTILPTNQTVTGFTAAPANNCIIDYVAIEKY